MGCLGYFPDMTSYVPRRPKPYRTDGFWIWTRRPDEVETYNLDLTELVLSGDAISEVEEKESYGVTIDSVAQTSNILSVKVSNGTGWATIKVTMTGGSIFEIPLKWHAPEGVVRDAWS